MRDAPQVQVMPEPELGTMAQDAKVAAPGGESQQTLIDSARLAGFIEGVPALRDWLPVRSQERVGLGQSNVTVRVELAGGPVILRRPPPGPLPPSAHDVLREFKVLQALHGSAVPVPHVYAACSDPSILGAPFFLMEALAGDAIRFELPLSLAAGPLEMRHFVGEQAVRALAALHTLEPAKVGLETLGKPSGYLARQLGRWRGQLEHAATRPMPDLEWVGSWLETHMPENSGPPSIVHGDYKLDNLLFSQTAPPELLGVVDWEMATLGDPLADLGWLLAFWREAGDEPPELKILPRVMELPGFPSRTELAAHYAGCVERSLPDLTFYVVFALWKMAVLLEGHWARHVRGTAGDFDFAYLETALPTFAARIRRVALGENRVKGAQ